MMDIVFSASVLGLMVTLASIIKPGQSHYILDGIFPRIQIYVYVKTASTSSA